MTREDYLKLHEQHEMPLFSHPDWLDIVSEGQWQLAHTEPKEGKHTFLVYQVRRKLGIKYSLYFQYTPYTGYFTAGWDPELDEVDFKRAVHALQDQIDTDYEYFSVMPSYESALPFVLNDYTVYARYTYIKYLTDDLLDNLDSRLRSTIKKNKENIEVKQSDNITDLCRLHDHVYQGKNPYNSKMLKKLWDRWGNEKLYILEAQKQNQTVGAVLVALDGKHAYYIAGGSEGSQTAMSLTLYETMRLSHQRGAEIFDFMGSTKPSIERFFRKYRPDTQTFFTLKKSNTQLARLLDLRVK